MLQRPTPAMKDKTAVKDGLTIMLTVAAILLLIGMFAFSFAGHCQDCRAQGTSYLPVR